MCRRLLQLSFLKPAFVLVGGLELAMLYFLSLPACKNSTPLATQADTTSHNFAFQIDTLGDGNSSVLNDVFIIDENNIWAVGEIYLNDATGRIDPIAYSAVHWDGVKWNLIRFYYRDNQNNILLITPIRGIYAFGPNDIWFAAGSVFRWNGNFIQSYLLRSTILGGLETVEKLWGTSSSHLYGVGNAGTIVYYNGSTWQKLMSGTTVDIQDIWGAVDSKTGQTTVLAVASLLNYGRALELLKIDGLSVTKLDTAGLHVSENSIWFEIGKCIYVTGFGVYRKSTLNDPQWRIDNTHPLLYKDRIRGTAWNDIFIAGSGGLMSHYNGLTWKHYTGGELPRWFARYQGLSVKEGLVVAVGWLDEKAVVLRGKRR